MPKYGPQIVTDGLVLCLDAASTKSYPGSGSTWYDLSGNGNNCTLFNSPSFLNDNRGCLDFDGSNDYVSVSPTSINSNITNSITLNCWVKVNSTSYQVIGGGQDNTGTRYTMSFNCNESLSNTYGFDLEATSGQVRLASSSNSLVLNTWVNLIGTYDGSTAKFYLNSSLVDTDTGTSGNIVDFDNIIFGRDISSGRYLNGNIAQVSIYNRTLSTNEVRQNFNATRGRFGV
jgi:hypothetical protein